MDKKKRILIAVITFENVTKLYKNAAKPALDNLTLTVENGSIFAFLGQNGAGKTTAVKLLCGILSPTSGTVFVDGISVEENPTAAKRRLALVSDEPDLPLRFTGREFLRFIADAYEVSKKDADERIAHFSHIFALEDKLLVSIGEYSHGMKQKLQLMASLLGDPQNWILDEPLTGLDPSSAFTLKELMKERAARGKTVFFSTHILEVAEKLSDTIGILHTGKVLFTGTLDELRHKNASKNVLSDNGLEALFLQLTASSALN